MSATIRTATPTVTYYQKLDDVAALIPNLESPHPSTRSGRAGECGSSPIGPKNEAFFLYRSTSTSSATGVTSPSESGFRTIGPNSRFEGCRRTSECLHVPSGSLTISLS